MSTFHDESRIGALATSRQSTNIVSDANNAKYIATTAAAYSFGRPCNRLLKITILTLYKIIDWSSSEMTNVVSVGGSGNSPEIDCSAWRLRCGDLLRDALFGNADSTWQVTCDDSRAPDDVVMQCHHFWMGGKVQRICWRGWWLTRSKVKVKLLNRQFAPTILCCPGLSRHQNLPWQFSCREWEHCQSPVGAGCRNHSCHHPGLYWSARTRVLYSRLGMFALPCTLTVMMRSPTLGLFIIHRPLSSIRHGLSNKEKSKCLASSVQKLWRSPKI